MKFDAPIIFFLVAQLITAGGTYAAIRADLREAIIKAEIAIKRLDEANARIEHLTDRQLNQHHQQPQK